MFQDLSYALRMFRKDWTFTIVAVLSLALGCGANSTMFSLVNSMLLRPLAVSRPHEVLTIAPKNPTDPFGGLSYPDYVDIRDRTKTMKDLVATALFRFGFSPSPDALPQTKYGLLVSGNLFEAMGVTPILGRGFLPDEDKVPSRDAVIVLGHDFWRDIFGADPNVIGRTIRLNGLDFTIIGVAPQTFTGMDEFFKAAFFVPAMMAPELSTDPNANMLMSRDWRSFAVKGRLRPGIDMAQAETELVSIAKGLEEAHPDTNKGESVVLRTEVQMHVQHMPREAGFMIMALIMAVVVLLISCFNVANLLLSRTRTREVALRLALGAGRSRLVRQLLTESLLLGIMGSLAGLWFAWAVNHLFNRIRVPSDLPFLIDAQTDHRVLIVTLASAFLSVLFFGLAPALRSSRVDLVSSLKTTDDAGSSPKRPLWGRNLLVVAQISLSVVLLVIVTMLYRGFSTQFAAGVGFRTNQILMMTFDPRLIRYTDDQITEFYRRLVDETATVPGVDFVSTAATVPLAINQRALSVRVEREGQQYANEDDKEHILYNIVDEQFFDAIGVPILRGRPFTATDTEDSPLVVIVNEVLAQKYWPNENPIGKRIKTDLGNTAQWAEIVGVARTSKYVWVTEGPTNYLYFPMSQHDRRLRILIVQSYRSFRSSGALTPAVRNVVRSLESNMPVFDVRTMEEYFETWVVASSNFTLYIVGSMGLTGLILSMIGLYGLVVYSVSRRTREFGIRMAIGARKETVLGMVLRQGAVLCAAGLAAGLAVSFPIGRLLKAIVFSATTDWMPYVVVPLLLMLVTLLATYGPARRASRIDPMRALRDE